MTDRSNEEWIEDLSEPGSRRDAALADLRARLVRGLGYALSSRPNVRQDDLEDFAQEALLKILAALDTFRGESQFTTWAQKIAVRVGLSELRRRRWKDVSLDRMVEAAEGDFVPAALADESAPPEERALLQSMLETLRGVIAEELTDKQRQAVVAALIQGMPLDEVARRMGTNRNALYKLLHDARRRLKIRLQAQGLSPEDLLAVAGS